MTVRRYVLGVLFDPHTREVLLIRKLRPAWQAGRLNAPGGKIEPGESARDAIAREIVEETSIEVGPDAYHHVCTLEGQDPDAGYHIEVFRAEVPGQMLHRATAVPPTDEALEVASLDPLPHTVIPNLRWLLPLAADTSVHYRPVLVQEDLTVRV